MLNVPCMVVTYSCTLHMVVQFFLHIVPTFAVSVLTFPSNVTKLYEDTYIDLLCYTNITEVANAGVNISFTWTAHDNHGASIDIEGEGYTITDQSNNSTLRIERLTMKHDNMAVYSCLVSAMPISGSVYITGSESNMDDITLNVSGKLYTNENCSNMFTLSNCQSNQASCVTIISLLPV